MFNLAAELPRLLPRAVAWSEAEADDALTTGMPLTDFGMRLARAVGVRRPDLIRTVDVPSLPIPSDPELRFAALQTGLLGPGMVGLTLGYAIYIVTGHGSNRLVSHECRHVYQYETAGSIAVFLPMYLQQIVQYGYGLAPFELDARAHERDGA